jgi:hypothetical protein
MVIKMGNQKKYTEIEPNDPDTRTIETLFLFANTRCSDCGKINLVEASEITEKPIPDEETWRVVHLYLMGEAIIALHSNPQAIIPLQKEWPTCCKYLCEFVDGMAEQEAIHRLVEDYKHAQKNR